MSPINRESIYPSSDSESDAGVPQGAVVAGDSPNRPAYFWLAFVGLLVVARLLYESSSPED